MSVARVCGGYRWVGHSESNPSCSDVSTLSRLGANLAHFPADRREHAEKVAGPKMGIERVLGHPEGRRMTKAVKRKRPLAHPVGGNGSTFAGAKILKGVMEPVVEFPSHSFWRRNFAPAIHYPLFSAFRESS